MSTDTPAPTLTNHPISQIAADKDFTFNVARGGTIDVVAGNNSAYEAASRILASSFEQIGSHAHEAFKAGGVVAMAGLAGGLGLDPTAVGVALLGGVTASILGGNNKKAASTKTINI